MCPLRLSDLIQAKLRSQTTVFPNPTGIIKELEEGKHQNGLTKKLGQDRELQNHTIHPTEKRGSVQPPGGILGLIYPLRSRAKVKPNTTSQKKKENRKKRGSYAPICGRTNNMCQEKDLTLNPSPSNKYGKRHCFILGVKVEQTDRRTYHKRDFL